MATPQLSICIPTYNRRKYLGDTITSVIAQVSADDAPKIEICVSDNASTDGTEILIHELQSSTPVNIIYSRNEINRGADANYLRAVDLASGDYCWYMGSDDIAVAGSIERIFELIEDECDIVLFNRIKCNKNMVEVSKQFWLDKDINYKIYNISNSEDFTQYTKSGKSIGAIFSYLSSIVFMTSRWRSIKFDAKFIGTGYAHAYMLLALTKSQACMLKYTSEFLVKCRGDNDSFQKPGNNGIIDRVMLDINGYYMIAENLFEKSKAHHDGILRLVRAERPAIITLPVLRLRSEKSRWEEISNDLKKAGYSRLLIACVTRIKLPLSMVKSLKDFITSMASDRNFK